MTHLIVMFHHGDECTFSAMISTMQKYFNISLDAIYEVYFIRNLFQDKNNINLLKGKKKNYGKTLTKYVPQKKNCHVKFHETKTFIRT